MTLKAEHERAFKLIEAAAITGARCPQNAPHGPLGSGCASALARAGWVRFAIYRHNFRVATILHGEHRGKSTEPAEPGLKPYRIGDKSGFYQTFV
jgi:hypothetical protein